MMGRLALFCVLVLLALSADARPKFIGGQPGALPAVPPQAAAAGFTTLAFNGDMSQGFNVGCTEEAGHDWYVATYGTINASCDALTYPYNDAGTTVLKITWSTTTYGSILSRTGMTTVSYNGTFGHDFPINAYYECVTRMTPLASMGPWFNCFMGSRGLINDPGQRLDNEYDLNEFHGGYFNNESVASTINWNCGNVVTPSCYWGFGFSGNLNTIIPGFDPEQYHKYGWLLQQTSPTNIHGCGYVDDVQTNCGDTSLDSREQVQRNFLILDITNSCNFDEGAFECMNQPIDSVINDGGNTKIAIGFAGYFQNWLIKIGGVAGATNANGVFRWSQDQDQSVCPPSCSFHIYNKDTGVPVPFGPAPYAGGGTLNPFTESDMYVKSFRVWSCAAWQTTECYP